MSDGAFAAFYAENADDLVLFFARRVLDSQVALDLAAETIAAAFIGRAQFRGSGSDSARAWLYGIARNQLSRYLRRGAAESRAIRRLGLEIVELSEEEHRRVEEQAAVEPLREAVRQALDESSPPYQEALRLRVVDGRSYAEIADSLGVSEQAVRTRVSRGLRSMAEVLEARGLTQEELA